MAREPSRGLTRAAFGVEHYTLCTSDGTAMPVGMNHVLPIACSTLLLIAGPAVAQGPPVEHGGEDIVVTGDRQGTIDLKRLRKAAALFREGRPAFAPQSSLLFQLRPKSGLVVEGMTLTLRNGDRTLPLPIDAEGRFELADVPDGEWELVHNRGKAEIALRPLVLSPGASETDRPLGDLRLQCRVAWELMKPDMSLFVRGGFGAMGGCSSSRFAFYFTVPLPIAAATAGTEGRAVELPVSADRRSYRAPLGDRHLPNTTRVHIRSG